MDSTAVSLCMENKLPIVVFNIFEQGSMRSILSGDTVGTIIAASD
jgi:uridylate kinase